jgi:ATP-dependent RNA helicase DHX36
MLLEAAIIQGEGSTVEIVCTQPRRIAAKSAARRVAFERNESLRQTVGYAVKDDTKLPINNGNITYCTTGVLLSRLRQSPERTMDMVTHIIVDEVHERDALIDFLMVNLKGLIRNRKAAGKRIPHVVLMSATLDINLFSNYFGEEQEDGLIKPCPSITVPGRSFPIQVKYLDDILEEVKGHSKHREWASLVRTPEVRKFLKRDGLRLLEESQPNIAQQTSIVSQPPAQIQDHHIEGFLPQLHLICATIDYILSTTSEGAILVFLPGMREIRLINSLLEEPHQEIQFIDMPSVKIYQLHSQLAQSQDDVFNSPPPGIRKVILATNIAETSLTIPDVRYVVDSGLYRENGFDQVTNMRSLQARWISKSSSKQRAGRAGRVAEGHYYGMFSKARFESFNPITTAELLRTDLQHICLQIKIRSPDCDISTELAGAIEAPEPGKIRAAIQALKDLDALTENEELTQLGSLLASLPVHPAMGKMVMLGIIFRCLDPMLILAASEQFRTLHMLPPQQRKAAANMRREFCHNTRSDHVSTINAFRWARSMQWDASFQELMAGRFLDAREFGRINTIILSIELTLVDSGLIPPMTEEDVRDLQYGHPSLNENSNNLSLIKALVVAGNPKNIAVASKPNALEISATRIFFMNWASSNFIERKVDRDNWRRKPELYVYNELFDSGRGTTIGGTTLCPPLIAAIFASQATIRPSTSSTGKDSLLLNEFLPVELRTEGDMGDVQPAQAIMTFRQAIRKVQTRAFGKLSQLYAKDSGRYLADEPAQNELIARLAHIISLADTAEVDESVESMVEDMEQVIERDLHSRKVGGG